MAIGEIIAGAIGGTAKTGTDIYNLYQQQVNKNRNKRDIENASEQTQSEYDKMIDILSNYRSGQTNLSTPEMYAQYTNTIQNYNPEDYAYDFDKFSYDKTVDDFVNPYYDKIIKGTTDQLQHTAAGSGLGRGTGAALNIATGVAQKEDELYKTALNQYNTDKSQAYKEYSDYITNMQNKLNNLSQNKQTKINLLSGAIGSDKTDESDYMSDLLSIMGDKASSGLQASLAANA